MNPPSNVIFWLISLLACVLIGILLSVAWRWSWRGCESCYKGWRFRLLMVTWHSRGCAWLVCRKCAKDLKSGARRHNGP